MDFIRLVLKRKVLFNNPIKVMLSVPILKSFKQYLALLVSFDNFGVAESFLSHSTDNSMLAKVRVFGWMWDLCRLAWFIGIEQRLCLRFCKSSCLIFCLLTYGFPMCMIMWNSCIWKLLIHDHKMNTATLNMCQMYHVWLTPDLSLLEKYLGISFWVLCS